MKIRFVLLFLSIFILASFLRFYRINELGTFLSDQAIELNGAYEILKGKFTLIGIKTSISEMRNGAVMYYLMAPLLYFFRFDPVAGGITQTILQLATILSVYLVLRKLRLENIGIIATFLLATSPLLVRFSRQTMLAYYPLFFATSAFFISSKLTQQFKRSFCLILGFLLGFMLQIHYSTLAVIIFALLFPWLNLKKKFILKYFLYLLLGFLIGFLPMIVFELRHEFFQTKMFLSFLSRLNQLPFSQFNLLEFWQDVISKLLFGENLWISSFYLLSLPLALLIFRKKLSLLEKLALLQIFSTFIFTFLFVRENVPHYLITSFVPLFIITAGLIEKVRKTISFRISFPLLIFCMLFFFLFNLPAYGLSENHGWTMTEGWNLPGTKKSAKIIFDDIRQEKDKDYNVVMIVDAQNQGMPLRYFLNGWNMPPLSIEQYDKAKFLYVIAEQGIVLEKIKIWELTSFGAFNVDKTWPIQNDFILHRLSKK